MPETKSAYTHSLKYHLNKWDMLDSGAVVKVRDLVGAEDREGRAGDAEVTPTEQASVEAIGVD